MKEVNKPTETADAKPVISDYEFDVIFDRVLRHRQHLTSQSFVSYLWKESLPYVQRLVEHPQPQFYISTIRNELSVIAGVCRNPGGASNVSKRIMLSFLVFVNLYYLRRDDKKFVDDVLPKLRELFDSPADSIWNYNKTMSYLEALPRPDELRQDEEPENTNEQDEDMGKRNPNQLGIKVLIKLYEKLWSRLGMSGCNNNEKALFLSAVSGYKADVLEDRLSRNFELTERDHRKDVDKANEFLTLIGIKNLIIIKKSKKK